MNSSFLLRRLGPRAVSVLTAGTATLVFGAGVVRSAAGQESEEAKVLAVAEAALAAITSENSIALTDLMVEEAVTFSVAEVNGRGTRYSFRSRAATRSRELTRDIVERGFDGEVRISGSLATVWLPYDLYIEGEWSHCGIDTFSMIHLDGEWRIAVLAWTVEQPPACRPHPDGPPGM